MNFYAILVVHAVLPPNIDLVGFSIGGKQIELDWIETKQNDIDDDDVNEDESNDIGAEVTSS